MTLSSMSLLTAILVGVAVFGLGYVWNAFRGARILLKGAKGGIPKARSLYWASLGRLVKWALIAAGILFVLVTWTARDMKDAADPAPSPSPSVSRR
ncbi:hypothetical protein AB0M20_01795 [Actinoplanes sp. NPDC051633]|uniref:hypothetical protein n=1 Tax=Actinoplanes sp. NPDC051633 TaxID=3155670 RepID=UPI003431ECF6